MAKNIDMATYEELVASGKPFVIDFWAEWFADADYRGTCNRIRGQGSYRQVRR